MHEQNFNALECFYSFEFNMTFFFTKSKVKISAGQLFQQNIALSSLKPSTEISINMFILS